MNTQTQVTKTAAPAAERTGFSRFSGLVERFKSRREARSARKEAEHEMNVMCRDVISTLAYVIANLNDNPKTYIPDSDSDGSILTRHATPKECIGEVSDTFVKLDDKRKQQVIQFLTTQLEGNAPYVSYKIDAIETIVAISASISEIARQLPVNERGNKITAGFETAITLLVALATEEPTITINLDQYASMRFACTAALWDLDFGDHQFWAGRLKDEVTRDFTIGRLLEMPPTINPDAHGWRLLQFELPDLGLDIARHESMKKFDFLMDAIVNGKEIGLEPDEPEAPKETLSVPVEALRAAALVTLPRFITNEADKGYNEDAKYREAWYQLGVTITHLSELRTLSPDMAELCSTYPFITGGNVAFTTYADERQFQGAFQMVHYYNKNRSLNRHLETLILEAAAELIVTYKEAKAGIENDMGAYRDSLTAKHGEGQEIEEALVAKERERLTAVANQTRYNAIFVLSKIHESGITVPGLVVKKVEKKPEEGDKKTEGEAEKKEAAGEGSGKTDNQSKGERKGKNKKELVTVFGLADSEGEVVLW